MGVPSEIPGLGSSAMVLRVAPTFDPLKAKIAPDEYFVLSAIDGKQSIRDVLNGTGLPVDRCVAIILKLREVGAVLLPGEQAMPDVGRAPTKLATPPLGTPVVRQPTPTPSRSMPAVTPARTQTPMPVRTQPPFAARTQTPTPMRPPAPQPDVPTQRLPPNLVSTALDAPTLQRRTPTGNPPGEPTGPELRLPDPTPEEVAALTEENDLADIDRRRILALQRLVVRRDPYALFGLPPGNTDLRLLKRTYFKMSKDVHPDRYYGKQLGSFADRLSIVFEALSRAYARLSAPDTGKRSGAHKPVTGEEQPQLPEEYAMELFERACSLEVAGEALEAMKLFAAVVRLAPQPRYLRRAATCSIAAGQPKSAVEYAKKAQAAAPQDPSAMRLLASAFKAADQLSDAEEVLVLAMAMKNENDTLTAELRHDLAEVRRLLSS